MKNWQFGDNKTSLPKKYLQVQSSHPILCKSWFEKLQKYTSTYDLLYTKTGFIRYLTNKVNYQKKDTMLICLMILRITDVLPTLVHRMSVRLTDDLPL